MLEPEIVLVGVCESRLRLHEPVALADGVLDGECESDLDIVCVWVAVRDRLEVRLGLCDMLAVALNVRDRDDEYVLDCENVVVPLPENVTDVVTLALGDEIRVLLLVSMFEPVLDVVLETVLESDTVGEEVHVVVTVRVGVGEELDVMLRTAVAVDDFVAVREILGELDGAERLVVRMPVADLDSVPDNESRDIV